MRDQAILLIGSSGKVKVADLVSWTEAKNLTYFQKLVKTLHGNRLIEMAKDGTEVEMLPARSLDASRIVAGEISKAGQGHKSCGASSRV